MCPPLHVDYFLATTCNTWHHKVTDQHESHYVPFLINFLVRTLGRPKRSSGRSISDAAPFFDNLAVRSKLQKNPSTSSDEARLTRSLPMRSNLVIKFKMLTVRMSKPLGLTSKSTPACLLFCALHNSMQDLTSGDMTTVSLPQVHAQVPHWWCRVHSWRYCHCPQPVGRAWRMGGWYGFGEWYKCVSQNPEIMTLGTPSLHSVT